MISWTIYMIMDYQLLVITYLLNKLLKYIINILIFWPYVNQLSLVVQSTSCYVVSAWIWTCELDITFLKYFAHVDRIFKWYIWCHMDKIFDK
jgi:hypothetical protein